MGQDGRPMLNTEKFDENSPPNVTLVIKPPPDFARLYEHVIDVWLKGVESYLVDNDFDKFKTTLKKPMLEYHAAMETLKGKDQSKVEQKVQKDPKVAQKLDLI